MRILVRFNTNYPVNSKFEWRVIVDGVEHLANKVMIETPTFTSSDVIEGHGQKWHIETIAEVFHVSEIEKDRIIAYIK